jgi:branched-chain amino acid transport system permease protein
MSLTSRVKLGFLIAALVLGVAAPYLFGSYYVSIFTLGLVYALFAMSIDLIGGYGGHMTLGQAGVWGIAAYGVAYMASRVGAAHGMQIAVGIGLALIVAMVFALMAMRTSGVYFLMVTLAQGMIVWGLSIRLSTITGAENGLRGVTRPAVVGAYWKYYYLCLAITTICGGLLWLIVRSPFGLSLRGLRESESRLRMLGYNTAVTKFYAFMLSAFFAAIAGVLYAYYNQFVSPSVTEFATSGQGVLMVVLGGVGTLVGPVLGAFAIVWIENVASVYIERWPTFMGLIFIVVIMFARRGFVGAISAAWNRWLRRHGREEEARRPTAAGAVLEEGDLTPVAVETETSAQTR